MTERGTHTSARPQATCGDLASHRPLITKSADTPLADLLSTMRLQRLTQVPISSPALAPAKYPTIDLDTPYLSHQPYGNLIGVVDVADIATYFGAFKAERFLSMTAEDLIGLNFDMRQGEKLNGLFVVQEDTLVSDIINFLAFGVRHVYVRPNATDETLRVLSVMDVLKYLADNGDESTKHLAIAATKLLFREETPFCKVPFDTTVRNALRMIVTTKADGAAVVDGEGILIGTLSISDVRNLTYGLGISHNLDTPVMEFLSTVNKGEVMHHPVTLGAEDSVGLAVDRMIEKDVRRVWVVDRGSHPLGVIAAEDIVSFFGRKHFA